MNKQRLMELAGISSNMNNPSQEPYAEIPSSAESPTGSSAGTKGFDQLGDDGEMNTIEKIREEAQRGADNPDDARECCENILNLISENGEDDDEHEELEPDNETRRYY